LATLYINGYPNSTSAELLRALPCRSPRDQTPSSYLEIRYMTPTPCNVTRQALPTPCRCILYRSLIVGNRSGEIECLPLNKRKAAKRIVAYRYSLLRTSLCGLIRDKKPKGSEVGLDIASLKGLEPTIRPQDLRNPFISDVQATVLIRKVVIPIATSQTLWHPRAG